MKVLKFGGSSVGSAESITKVVEIIRKTREEDSCAIVLSAMQGTTDYLNYFCNALCAPNR